MTLYEVHRTPAGTTVTPLEDDTPSGLLRYLANRPHGALAIRARDEQQIRRTLPHYFTEET